MSADQEHLRNLLQEIEPHDSFEAEQLSEATHWVSATADLYRRVRHPVAPRQHLVSYFLLVDSASRAVLLGDHISSGLWLPSGGHVEPGEDPAETVRRECLEELAVEARFHPRLGAKPLFITITESTGQDTHLDVSLWYVLDGLEADELKPDPNEYLSVRWWPVAELRTADPARFDPQLNRMLDKLEATLWRE